MNQENGRREEDFSLKSRGKNRYQDLGFGVSDLGFGIWDWLGMKRVR
jgi:hypothetical protein